MKTCLELFKTSKDHTQKKMRGCMCVWVQIRRQKLKSLSFESTLTDRVEISHTAYVVNRICLLKISLKNMLLFFL